MKLTDLGMENWKTIPSYIMEFIYMLKNNPLNEGYYHENGNINDREWQFLPKCDSYDYCEK